MKSGSLVPDRMVATCPAASRCFMRFGRMLMPSPLLGSGWRVCARAAASSLSLDGDALAALLPVGLIRLDGGDDLLGHQVDAAHRDLVGHQALAAPEHHVPGIDDVDDALELLDHGVG